MSDSFLNSEETFEDTIELMYERELQSDPSIILNKCLERTNSIGTGSTDFTNEAQLATGWVDEDIRMASIETCKDGNNKIIGIKFALAE